MLSMEELMEDDLFEDELLAEYNKNDDIVDLEVSNFFRDNLLATRSAVDNESFKKFSNLNSNEARVDFILGYPEPYELEIQVESDNYKDPIMTRSAKENGNSAFSFGHYIVAIDQYNIAARLAPKEELSVILANRAAAFYHMEKFDLALRDCEEASKLNYPKNLMYKLEERRARCFLALKVHTKALEAFRNALRALDDCRLPNEKKIKFESDIRVMLAIMEKGQKMNETERGVTKEQIIAMENNRLKEKDRTPKMKDYNRAYPACSKSVDFKITGGNLGRYAIATRDIQPGEIIVVENPHCATLLAEYRLTHCHKCTVRIVQSYPATCYHCSSISYCSPKCRDLDSNTHKIECKILETLWYSHTSVTCMLALRAIIQQPFEQFIKFRNTLNYNNGNFEGSKSKPYVSGDYNTFYNLVTHEDERSSEDLFHRAYMAAWLLRVLKTSSYLPESVKTPDAAEIALSDAELFIGGSILHNLQSLQFNSHEISEFTQNRKRPILVKGKNLFVGGGVYPTVALFNHSCNPSVVRYFIGNTMIVRAIRSIPSGKEISENYGPMFTEEDENERKRKLRLQYWFDCTCEACRDHWPLLQEIDANVLRFKCDTGPTCGNILPVKANTQLFMIPCSKCGNSTNLLKGLKAIQDTDDIYKIATKYLAESKIDEALKRYLDILKIIDATLALPIRDYHICQQGARICMLASGNSSLV